MNSLAYSLLATGATVAVGLALIGLPELNPGVAEDEITGSIAGSRQSAYILEGAGAECRVRRGARIAPTVYRFVALGDCGALLRRGDTPAYWTETAGGGIVISDQKGVIIEFAQADGAHLESVYPLRPLYSLTRSPD